MIEIHSRAYYCASNKSSNEFHKTGSLRNHHEAHRRDRRKTSRQGRTNPRIQAVFQDQKRTHWDSNQHSLRSDRVCRIEPCRSNLGYGHLSQTAFIMTNCECGQLPTPPATTCHPSFPSLFNSSSSFLFLVCPTTLYSHMVMHRHRGAGL